MGGGEADLYKSLDSLRTLINKLNDERNYSRSLDMFNCYGHTDFSLNSNKSLATLNNTIAIDKNFYSFEYSYFSSVNGTCYCNGKEMCVCNKTMYVNNLILNPYGTFCYVCGCDVVTAINKYDGFIISKESKFFYSIDYDYVLSSKYSAVINDFVTNCKCNGVIKVFEWYCSETIPNPNSNILRQPTQGYSYDAYVSGIVCDYNFCYSDTSNSSNCYVVAVI
jgi:hypothetical protein